MFDIILHLLLAKLTSYQEWEGNNEKVIFVETVNTDINSKYCHE